jgi:hypothetical protein
MKEIAIFTTCIFLILSKLMRTLLFTFLGLLMTLTFLSSNSYAQVTNGLVAHYSFNGNANDMIGTKHGTVHGAVLDTGRGGVPNAAYFFDGIDDYIDFGTIDPLGNNSDATVCIWFKPTRPVTPFDFFKVNYIDNEYLFSTGGQTLSTGYAVIWAKSAVKCLRKTSSKATSSGHEGYADNNWHQVCFTFDNSLNRMKVYLDGVLKRDTLGSVSSYTNSSPSVYAGNTNNSTWGNFYFGGLMDDIKIYSRALNQKEIDTLFGKPLPCETYSKIYPVSCDTFVSPSGKYSWSTSGNYSDTLTNAKGCDSVIAVHLSIRKIDTAVTVSGNILVSNTNGMNYQWLDCDSGMVPISGATNQVYTVSKSGNYAVEISGNGCSDTSACHQVLLSGLMEVDHEEVMRIYPNPSRGELFIDYSYGASITNPGIQLIDVEGRIVFQQIPSSGIGQNTLRLDLDLAAGNYILQLTSNGKVIESEKIIIQ